MTSTKRSLVWSILSLLLCVAMLAGTTFAWFTDSVTSGKNQIVSGDLDVELYHGDNLDESVSEATDLFTQADGSAILWEPGAMAYENFKVANVGTLALKYYLSMNIADHNTVQGTNKSLADVLKVAVLDGEFNGDRAAAQALTFESTLSDFVKEGNLLPEEADTYAVVIYWEPSANDNDYNLNNGKTSSDGEPLYIDLGITLTAAQDTVESDSFDNQYDAEAVIPGLPITITYMTNADVEMGTLEYKTGEENAFPEQKDLGSLFSQFFAKRGNFTNVWLDGYYTDKDFATPADMPTETGKYTVYVKLNNNASFDDLQYTDGAGGTYLYDKFGSNGGPTTMEPESSIDIVSTYGMAYMSFGYQCAGLTENTPTILVEKKNGEIWEPVDESRFLMGNMLMFYAGDDGDYRLRALYYTATDQDGNPMYYDYAEVPENLIHVTVYA